MRMVNILVICALVLAASLVYKIKFDSTLQAARVAKMHAKLRHERDAIAVLRAEWARLDTPGRIQQLAERFLTLQPIKADQFDDFDHLPPRPPAPAPGQDPIAALLNAGQPAATGSIPAPAGEQR
jgi:cell division protein FtsL